MYLPGARGFDEYLGIPYSDDMGEARTTPCQSDGDASSSETPQARQRREAAAAFANVYKRKANSFEELWQQYIDAGFAPAAATAGPPHDPAGDFLPLVHQAAAGNGVVNTTVLEQPLDFTTLADKYKAFVEDFVTRNARNNFFLYMPFSHVHTTAGNQPEMQYAGCDYKGTTDRGAFGDALAEADGIVGHLMDTLEAQGLGNDTLILFASGV
jgi:hypothetical protein